VTNGVNVIKEIVVCREPTTMDKIMTTERERKRERETTGIKLLGKRSAIDNPSTPSNFRPIALTSCIGKLFTSIVKSRWLNYMLENGYLDPRIQKCLRLPCFNWWTD